MVIKKVMIVFILCNFLTVQAQEITTDTLSVKVNPDQLKFNYKQLIIPAVLIGYGVIGIESDGLKRINSGIKEEVNEHIDKKITIDDFSQYATALSVYALNTMGIKGKNNFKDRTIILAISTLIVGGTVLSLKSLTKIERPDGSAKNSFPSGHAANAFAGAEFLWQEYKDVSIWYGISGYLVATGTGLFRIYNDRHWFTDVVAGAGIGILSTKIAYWIYPFIQDKIFNSENKKSAAMIAPFYNGQQVGASFIMNF
ncbi:phosphatase PAP2 family protein [Flavobacterium sp. '19STA2R22 D10 B1']|uniref:phosphatase PAP2 family protein n=1 Tax=Flavobacterium aerium TaxID=3037261 RepID=UPI00278C3282|nr:phosphatase PAP2 family protein [Flavobacterium sp. '19STA2R22 D10 B1']